MKCLWLAVSLSVLTPPRLSARLSGGGYGTPQAFEEEDNRDVIICHLQDCPSANTMAAELRQSGRCSAVELAAVEAYSPSTYNAATLASLGTENRREETLKVLHAIMEVHRTDVANVTTSIAAAVSSNGDAWKSLSVKYFPHLGMDMIRDPQGTLDSETVRQLASKLPCNCFEPELDEPLSTVPRATTSVSPKYSSVMEDLGERTIVTPYDPAYSHQWHLRVAKVDRAWAKFSGATRGMAIAVIDTGGSFHPDLAQNLWIDPDNPKCKSATPTNPTLEPGCYGWDFSIRPEWGNPLTETHFRGTQVAGMIAAKPNNGIGGAGACWGCKILFLKVFNDKGFAWKSSYLAAYEFIIEKKIKISNHSYGHYKKTKAVSEVLDRLAQTDHLFVTKAGDHACDADDPRGLYPCKKYSKDVDFPHVGLYGNDMMLTVGSMARNLTKAWNSNWGNNTVDIFAPGDDVYILANTRNPKTRNFMTFSAEDVYLGGSTMAAPFVAGVAALVWGANPTWTAKHVKSYLKQTAIKTNHFKDLCVSGGYINAEAAVSSATVLDPAPIDPALFEYTDRTDFFYQQSGTSQSRKNFPSVPAVVVALICSMLCQA